MRNKKLLLVLVLLAISLFFSWLEKPQTVQAQISPDNPFQYKEAPICAEERINNPTIMRLYTAEACGHCRNEVRPAYEEVIQEYQGLVENRVWVKDQMQLPETEEAICYDFTDGYCPNPTIVLGCRYYGIGFHMPMEEFKQGMREVINYLLSLPPASPTPTPYTKGDVNHSGSVDIQDIFITLQNYGKHPSQVSNYYDPQQDDKINSLDFAWVVKDWFK